MVAHEPAVAQPLNMYFDERGRMWVTQYLQYPFPAGLKIVEYDKYLRAVFDKVPPPPPHHFRGKDKITIHEDTDGDGVFDKHKTFLDGLNTNGVTLLADLFHMNIEESDIAATLREGARHVGHVHFADSNRRPVGNGHTDMKPIADALREIGYDGCISAEAFDWPDPDAAAQQTLDSYRKYFG